MFPGIGDKVYRVCAFFNSALEMGSATVIKTRPRGDIKLDKPCAAWTFKDWVDPDTCYPSPKAAAEAWITQREEEVDRAKEKLAQAKEFLNTL